MPPALCPLCREPQPIQHGLFLCQKVLRFSRSIKRSIPHPFSLYQPFADGSTNPYPLKHTTFLAFFVDLPGDQRNTASSHKESMRRTRPPMHPNTSGLQSGLQKQKRRQFSTNQRRFSWWRRWESNPCPKGVQRRCLRVQAIYNIPSASRRSPG